MFILATTEAHKLPETIVSRTQRYTFKPVDQAAVVRHLASIADKEGIHVAESALELIAAHGEGSFRDSISLLDQMRHSNTEVTIEDVERALGVAPTRVVTDMLAAIEAGDRERIEASLQQVHEIGVDIVQFAGQLAASLRQQLREHTEIRTQDLVLLDELARIGAQPHPHIALTLAVYRPLASSTPATKRVQAPKPETVIDTLPDEPHFDGPIPEEDEDVPNEETAPEGLPAAPTQTDTTWEGVLAALKLRHNTLYGVVRMGQPDISDNTVTLSFSFPFHVRRISDEKNRRVIETVIQETLGKPLKVLAVKSESKPTHKKSPTPPAPKKSASDHVSSVSNIFGGAEIVES